MFKQNWTLNYVYKCTIDNICFVDTESTSTLVIIAGEVSADITSVTTAAITCKMVYIPTA